ncbi:DedA family protein [Parasphingorhabdus halotolerans]|uniref:VTT domain-containing protein n=1 Tax=Parasphingorhabdus halotolerans TaxID=2725558 RepID=A0A6H2DKQ1_9SPHN|nr:hypothetical protein HF685_06245 [Parasphingorhabdus halotolerans]
MGLEFLLPSTLQCALFVAFIVMFLNSSVMVPPSEIVCGILGYAAATYGYDWMLIALAATFGNLSGTAVWFHLGRYHRQRSISGEHLLAERSFRRLVRRTSDKIVIVFERYGWAPVFSLRLVPLIRSIISYPAGRSQLSGIQFYVASFLGIFIWCILWVWVGYGFGPEVERLPFLLIAFMIAIGGFFAWFIWTTKRKYIGSDN